ncbi:MAG: RNA polymerase sigma factor [Gemmatimonadales bacterium]
MPQGFGPAPTAPDGSPPERGGPPGLGLSLAHEASLQSRLIARDEQALVELVGFASPWLLGVALGMLSDRDEAEEVVHETFTIVWRRVDLFDQESGRLLPWLLRIARNRAIDRLRARRRRTLKLRRLEAYGAPGERVAPAIEPDESARPGWHVHDTVHQALGTLPQEQHAVVDLAYFQGLTQSEIAEQLGIPLGTVKTRLRLAFDKLRPRLAGIREWVL